MIFVESRNDLGFELHSNYKSRVKYFHREKEPIIYEGDLMDEAGVLDFLTSLEAMDLPDRIEEVNAKILSKIIEDSDYVAVLFCKLARCRCMTPHPDALYVLQSCLSYYMCPTWKPFSTPSVTI